MLTHRVPLQSISPCSHGSGSRSQASVGGLNSSFSSSKDLSPLDPDLSPSYSHMMKPLGGLMGSSTTLNSSSKPSASDIYKMKSAAKVKFRCACRPSFREHGPRMIMERAKLSIHTLS